jgi:hypothetical protein
MRLLFKDGLIRELPFNASLGARLIHLSQKRENPDFRVELDPELSHAEQKKQASELQSWVDAYRLHDRCNP